MPVGISDRQAIEMTDVAVAMRLILPPESMRDVQEFLEGLDDVKAVSFNDASNWENPVVWVTLNPDNATLAAIFQIRHRLTAWAVENKVELIDLDGRRLTR